MSVWLKKLFKKGTGEASSPANATNTMPAMDLQEIEQIFAAMESQSKARAAHERAWDAVFRRATFRSIK